MTEVRCQSCRGTGSLETPSGLQAANGPREPCNICHGQGYTVHTEGCLAGLIGRLMVWIGLPILVVMFGLAVYNQFFWDPGTDDLPGVLAEEESTTTWAGTLHCGERELGLEMTLTVAAGTPQDARTATSALRYYETDQDLSGEPTHTSTARGTLVGRDLNLVGEPSPDGPGTTVVGFGGAINDDATLLLGEVQAAECDRLGLETT